MITQNRKFKMKCQRNLSQFLRILFLFSYILIVLSCGHMQNEGDSFDQPLFYQVVGAGKPPVIMLHGILGSHRYWDGVVPQLSKNHELILPDLLGFGDSPKPEIEYSIQQHLTKIEDVIERTHSEKSSIVIVGHSMGAFLALNYTITHPDQVKKLILINAPMKTDEESLKKALPKNRSNHTILTRAMAKLKVRMERFGL